MAVAVKICGIRDVAALEAATKSGATFIGFNFVPTSKRFIAPEAAANIIQAATPPLPHIVGLFVDPSDAQLREALGLVKLDMIQLHGNETPARVCEVKELTGLPVIKAIAVACIEDLDCVPAYEATADWLLFDTKIGPALTGGTGQAFDWTLLDSLTLTKPWMLGGGLNAANVAEAIAISGTIIVDISSGVEADGAKSPEKIREFLRAVKDCD